MKKYKLTALTMLLLLALLLGTMTGCAKSAMPAAESAAEAAYDRAEPAAAEEMPFAEPASDDALATSANTFTEEGAAGEAQTDAKNSLAEKIIYSGYLNIETTAFDKAIESVESMVNEFSGFIESSSVDGSTRYNSDGTTSLVNRSAYYVLRVPCGRFREFLKRSGNIGNVLNSNTSAENITSQFTDAEARKASLDVQEERLLAMLEKTEDVESLIELESRLSDVRYEIESIERQLINWQNSVDYSTVTLNLTEVEIYTPVVPVTRTFGEKLGSAFADGWHGFTNFLKGFILWFAEALPTLILLAAVALGVVFLVRKLKRRKTAKRAASLPYATPVPKDKPNE